MLLPCCGGGGGARLRDGRYSEESEEEPGQKSHGKDPPKDGADGEGSAATRSLPWEAVADKTAGLLRARWSIVLHRDCHPGAEDADTPAEEQKKRLSVQQKVAMRYEHAASADTGKVKVAHAS